MMQSDEWNPSYTPFHPRMPYDQGGVPMSRLAHMRAVVALLRGENRVQTTEA